MYTCIHTLYVYLHTHTHFILQAIFVKGEKVCMHCVHSKLVQMATAFLINSLLRVNLDRRELPSEAW